jgi:hypothetical protein
MTTTTNHDGAVADDVREIAQSYFRAWREKDLDTLRSILSDEVTFRGPLGVADDAEQCLTGLQAMSHIVTDIVIQKMVADGPDVLTWFDLHTEHAPPAPTVNWSRIENGKIVRIRATFDPRPLLG